MRLLVAAGATIALLASAGPASANHVTATLSATATLGKRVGNSWQVAVDWAITCNVPNALYFGNLSLVDQGSGESFYLGGTSTASGKSTASVPMKTTPRTLKPLLSSSCASSPDFHGSGNQPFLGNEVVVPVPSCDPDLLAKALREYEVAKDFYNAAVQDLRQAHEQMDRTLSEWAKQKAKKKLLKQALKEVALLLGEDAAAAASVVSFWVKIGVIINNIIFKVLPKLSESNKAFKAAKEDFERGEAWRKRAEASLDAALKQGPCIGDLRSRLDQALDEQRKQEAARALIETWENNGYLYLNPATGEVLDEAAALKEARKALEGGTRSLQARAGAATKPTTATRRQIEAAIAKITVAERIAERMGARVRRADDASETLRRKLRPLIR